MNPFFTTNMYTVRKQAIKGTEIREQKEEIF